MEWITRHSCRIAVAVMIISFIASAALAVHEGPELRYPDENEYRLLAANLVHQHRFTLDGVHLTASRPPGYAWFLSLPLLFGATNTELRLFNIGSYLICQLLLYLLARRIGSDFSAAVAMLMCLAYPVLAYTATLLYPQTVCAALLLCVAWILRRCS